MSAGVARAERARPAAVTRALAAVASFEAAFAAFVNAGYYKGAKSLAWVPVDLTALTFGLSIAAALWVVTTRGIRLPRAAIPVLGFGMAFVLFVMASLIWSPSDVYGVQKAFYVATLTSWALLGPALVIAAEPRRAARFVFFLFAFAVWLGIDATITAASSPGIPFVNVLGSNYLGVGRTLGIGSAIALTVALSQRVRPLWRFLAIAFFAVSLYLFLLVGGRGPLMATLVASLVPVVLGIGAAREGGLWLRRYLPWLLGIIVAIALGVTALATQPDPPATLRRLQVLTTSSMGGRSAATRAYWWKGAPALWAERPVAGHGVGSWPVLMSFADARAYPHDIFLEILVEEGAVGLLLFVGMLAAALAALRPWRTISADPWRLLLLMLFVNALVNAMVSGDLSDNRFLFAVAGFMAFGAAREAR